MQPKGSFGTFEKLLTVYSEGKGRSKRKSEEKRGKSEREREKKTAIIALLNFFLFIIGVANGTSKNVVLGKILAGSRNLGSVFDKSRSLVFSWFVFTFFESRNFSSKSLGLGFLTRISASRRVSDFTIHHPL